MQTARNIVRRGSCTDVLLRPFWDVTQATCSFPEGGWSPLQTCTTNTSIVGGDRRQFWGFQSAKSAATKKPIGVGLPLSMGCTPT